MRTASARGALGILAAALAAAGCAGPDQAQPPHPPDEISFPVEVTAGPNDRQVWVTSGNFDLGYRGGAVQAFEVGTHAPARSTGADGEERALAVQVGGFPGPFRILTRDGRPVAGYVASRAENALFHVRFGGDGPDSRTLSCDGGERASSGILACPTSEAIERVRIPDPEQLDDEGEPPSDPDTVRRSVGRDPFAVHLHRRGPSPCPDVLLTGALADGRMATFRLDEQGRPELVDARQLDPDLGRGLYAFAESSVTGRIYAVRKGSNTVQVLEVAPKPPRQGECPSRIEVEEVDRFPIPASASNDHARELAVSRETARLYIAYRSPPSVVVVDVRSGFDGPPSERVLAKIPVATGPADVQVAPPPGDGRGERVYVSGFQADRIDVVDPGLGARVDTVETGDGPFGMAFVDNEELGLRRLYVANFFSETLGVVELDPASPWYHTEIAEIR